MDRKNITVPWSGWRIKRELGKGTYGAVYEIERDLFGTIEKAAMKVISIPADESVMDSILFSAGYDPDTVQKSLQKELMKAQQEYILMNKLKGITNIVSCEDFAYQEREDGRGYLVYIRMELLKSLQIEIREKRRKSIFFTEEEVIRIGQDVSRALAACDQRGLIHRDIKPSNILVSEYGDYKIGDFGTARGFEHTMQATYAGTQSFMAPEVYKREPYGKTVDIYSLGLVMYWLMNRCHMPFVPLNTIPGSEELQVAETRRVRGDKLPEPCDASTELSEIILKACDPDSSKRYHSASEMLRDLTDLREGRYVLKSSGQQAENQAEAGFIKSFRTANMVPEIDDDYYDEPTMAMFQMPYMTKEDIPAAHAPEISVPAAGKSIPAEPEIPVPEKPATAEPAAPAPEVPAPGIRTEVNYHMSMLDHIEQTMSAYLKGLSEGNDDTSELFSVPDSENVPENTNHVVYWLTNAIKGNIEQNQETGSKLFQLADELETRYGKYDEALELYRVSAAAGFKKGAANGLRLSKKLQDQIIQSSGDDSPVSFSVDTSVNRIIKPELLKKVLAVYVVCRNTNTSHTKKLSGEVFREAIRSGLAEDFYGNAPSLITDREDPEGWLYHPGIKGYYAVDNKYMLNMLKSLYHIEQFLFKGPEEDVYYISGNQTYIFEKAYGNPVYPKIELIKYSSGFLANEVSFAALYGPDSYESFTARVKQTYSYWEVLDVFLERQNLNKKESRQTQTAASQNNPASEERKPAPVPAESSSQSAPQQVSLQKTLSVYLVCKNQNASNEKKLGDEVLREVFSSGLAKEYYGNAPYLIRDKVDPEGWLLHQGIKGYYALDKQHLQKLLNDLFRLEVNHYRGPAEDIYYISGNTYYIFEKESANTAYPEIERITFSKGLFADSVSFTAHHGPRSYDRYTARVKQEDLHWAILDVYMD